MWNKYTMEIATDADRVEAANVLDDAMDYINESFGIDTVVSITVRDEYGGIIGTVNWSAADAGRP